MNLPNKLTLLRIILVPFFIATLLIPFPHHYAVSLMLFIVASVTDYFDGKIARKNNLVTDFGKFLDPLADKILVISALVCFVSLGLCDCILVIIVLFREFAVTSVRLVAASQGNVVAANIFGKIKTVTQMIAIIAVFVLQYILELVNLYAVPAITDNLGVVPTVVDNLSFIFFIAGEILLWISTFFAILSGIIYIYQNKSYISIK